MKKVGKLESIYTEFEAKYSNKSKEEMDKIIENLEKEINGKETALEKTEGETKEKLQKDIEQAKKRLNNLKGYSKNKTQIEKIREVKSRLTQKLQEQVKTRDDSKKAFEKAKTTYEKVNKKFVDEKYTMKLTNDEYNKLADEVASAKKEMDKQENIMKRSEEKINRIKSEIGKCDLAWKTLFVNKDWDEIQRRAVESEKRYTRKIDSENEIPLKGEEKEDEEKAETEKENEDTTKTESSIEEERENFDMEAAYQKQRAESIQDAIDEKNRQKSEQDKEQNSDNKKENSENKDEEVKAVTVAKRGFSFRNLWNRIVNWIKGKDKEEKAETTKPEKQESKEEKASEEKNETVKPEKQEVKEEKASEEKNETVKPEKQEVKEEKETAKTERDKFLEGLRLRVDEEYRTSIEEEKNKQYREKHEIKENKGEER